MHDPKNLHLRTNSARQQEIAKLIHTPAIRPAHAKDLVPSQLDKARHEVKGWPDNGKLDFADKIARLNKKVVENWDEANWPWDLKLLDARFFMMLSEQSVQDFMKHMLMPRVTVSKAIPEDAERGRFAFFPWFSPHQLQVRLDSQKGRLVTQLQRDNLNQNMKDFMSAEFLVHSLDKILRALAKVPIEGKPRFHPLFPFQVKNPVCLMQYWAYILQGKMTEADTKRFLMDDKSKAQGQQAIKMVNDNVAPEDMSGIKRDYSLIDTPGPKAKSVVWVAETTDGSATEED